MENQTKKSLSAFSFLIPFFLGFFPLGIMTWIALKVSSSPRHIYGFTQWLIYDVILLVCMIIITISFRKSLKHIFTNSFMIIGWVAFSLFMFLPVLK